MKQEIKEKWIEALRSGEYEQGMSTLHFQEYSEERFCCLGVLCELAVKEEVVSEVSTERTNFNPRIHFLYDGEKTGLPPSVLEWTGLDHKFPELDPDSEEDPLSLPMLNDSGDFSFDDIAALIDKYL